MDNSRDVSESKPCVHHMKWKVDCIWCWVESCKILKTKLEAALERERGLMRELCEYELINNFKSGGDATAKDIIKKRGWPDDLFDEKEGE